jgi:hypothetical protein
MHGQAARRVSRLSAFAIGAKFTVDYSLREVLRRHQPDRAKQFQRTAFLLGHELLLGPFTFAKHLGVYVWSPVRALHPVYQHYSLHCRVAES